MRFYYGAPPLVKGLFDPPADALTCRVVSDDSAFLRVFVEFADGVEEWIPRYVEGWLYLRGGLKQSSTRTVTV